jgi:hypothetical protein
MRTDSYLLDNQVPNAGTRFHALSALFCWLRRERVSRAKEGCMWTVAVQVAMTGQRSKLRAC